MWTEQADNVNSFLKLLFSGFYILHVAEKVHTCMKFSLGKGNKERVLLRLVYSKPYVSAKSVESMKNGGKQGKASMVYHIVEK